VLNACSTTPFSPERPFYRVDRRAKGVTQRIKNCVGSVNEGAESNQSVVAWGTHGRVENKTQLGLPEPGVPHEALEYLAAVGRHFAPGVTRPPTNVDIAANHIPRLSARGWDHRKHLLRSLKLGGRDWVEVWPPQRGWRPSWEGLIAAAPALVEPDGSDGLVHQIVDEVFDKSGKFVEKRILKQLGHIGAAAAAFVYGVLDVIDGRVDGTVQIARFLRHAFETLLPWLCDMMA